MDYLAEHVDAILGALRHSRDVLLRKGGSWETTAWTRSMADAAKLAQTLQDAVFAEADGMEEPVTACVGLVRAEPDESGSVRWGVLVRLGRA